MDVNEKLKKLYRESRTYVSQGKRDETLAALETFVHTAYVHWKEHPPSDKKDEMKARINEWAIVVKKIRERGINEAVLKKFALKPEDSYVPVTADWEAEVFELRKSGVVKISTNESVGTGFIISENGYLLTNEHVVANRKSSWISFSDDDKSYRICIIAVDKKRDVALCHFEPSDILSNFAAIPCIKDYSMLRQGDKIMIIGNAKGRGLAPVPGTIRHLHDDSGDLVSTIPSNRGDSGSPVFNRKGECIGIHKSSDKEAKDFAYAIPMNEVEKLLKKWIEAHKIIL